MLLYVTKECSHVCTHTHTNLLFKCSDAFYFNALQHCENFCVGNNLSTAKLPSNEIKDESIFPSKYFSLKLFPPNL